MNNENEKLERFSKAVEEEVDSQIQKIIAEAEASKSELVEKANDESLNVAYEKIKEEIKMNTAKNLKAVSKAELDSKREILMHRDNLSNKVFENVKSKLINFTNSQEYKDYLIKLLKEELSGNSIESELIIYLSKKDMQYADDLKKLFGDKISCIEKNNIKLGGLCILYSNCNQLIDKTLDSDLLEQKELFNNSSSLKLS